MNFDMPDGALPSPAPDRPTWMGLLARATLEELTEALGEISPLPAYESIRKPEQGLAMVRGRAGGVGNAFNLGEMTMTRCAVRLESAPHPIGLAYIAGRDARRAELAALFDALLQTPALAGPIQSGLLTRIRNRLAQTRRTRAAETAATRVDFFTMVREQGDV